MFVFRAFLLIKLNVDGGLEKIRSDAGVSWDVCHTQYIYVIVLTEPNLCRRIMFVYLLPLLSHNQSSVVVVVVLFSSRLNGSVIPSGHTNATEANQRKQQQWNLQYNGINISVATHICRRPEVNQLKLSIWADEFENVISVERCRWFPDVEPHTQH